MRPILFVSLIFVAAVACASTRAAPPAHAREPAAATTLAIAVPPQLADFGLIRRHDYEDRGAGVLLRYANPDSVTADVFVYPGPDLDQHCAPPCAAQALESELADFRASFPELRQRGYVQSIVIVADERLVPPAGARWKLGHHLQLTVTRSGRAQRSEYYLFYLPGYRVKIRSTFDDRPPRLQSLQAFVSGIVPALARTGSSAPPT